MKPNEYNRLKNKIEKTYREEISALNLLWKKYGEGNLKQENGKTGGKGVKKEVILEAVQAQTSDFSMNDIDSWIKQNKPTEMTKISTIRVTLNRLVGNEIEVAKKGQGRSPNFYRKSVTGPKSRDSDN